MEKPHTLDQIISAATEELEERGINGLRVRLVAERAGLSPGTVTHYYPTTQHLLDATIESFQQQAWDMLSNHPWFEGESTLEQVLTDFYGLCRANRELVRARFFLTAREGNVSDTNWRQSLEPFLNRLAQAYGPAARLYGHSIVLLTMRFAFHSKDELLAICGTKDLDAAHEMVIEHLVTLAASGPWSTTSPRRA
ncbi:transcriptional regulator BetI [Enhygromyxa salina]|uniref:Transcriptional regulator BetI n=1 Tax=Enhygromyxa salina TaxID=215803 RepID=A0A2S9YBJ1_9BACT|nr:TetR/AcrR family transcriptional regulator [Enhygromyxa salina]PRQ02376.1 transcriptional regulator BetI [Enhygromyxa salina]